MEKQVPGRSIRVEREGRTDVGHSGRRRHMARGAETSGRGWWVARLVEV